MSDVDHRTAQTPVRDQESRHACTGFAVAAAHEWMDGCEVRSVEDVLWAAHRAGADPLSEAVSVEHALSGLATHGHASEMAWPFDSPAWPADRPTAATDAGNRCDLPAWSELADHSFDSIDAELNKGQAVILTVAVLYAAWVGAAQSGRVELPAVTKINGYHAVTAVGTESLPTQRYVIFKNSWGETWGDHGFGYLSESYLDRYLSVAHTLEALPA